jgi:phenylpyruvate tautomerase PptA (4-oxalocrotonate tautomerase family)
MCVRHIARDDLAAALADVIAEACGHDPETVHIVFEPSASGRISFGCKLI